MKIDDNPMEIEAMELFKQRKGKEARELQEEFLRQVKESGVDHCTCPGGCKFHGDCVQCVIIHRGHGQHLPHCFREMLNRRLKDLSGLSEHSFDPKAE